MNLVVYDGLCYNVSSLWAMIMSRKVYRILPLFNRLFLNEKCSYVQYLRQKSHYNVLFFGSETMALNSLQRVNQLRKNENLIKRLDLVTANKSRNMTVIEKYAQAENITVLHWPNININNNEYDIGLLVAFGHLIKDDVLKKFPLGIVTVHPSLLPRWRGAAPIIYTLLHGDEVGGVSLMKIKPDIFDVGEIISRKEVPIPKDIKLPELTKQLSDIGAEMLIECLQYLPTSLEHSQPQSTEGVTYAKRINKSISEVQWANKSAREVYNLYRSIYGIYALTTKFEDKTLKLFNAFLVDTDTVYSDKSIGTLEYCKKTQAVRILCKDKKFIYFKSVRIIGKREISALDFFNGYIKNKSDKRKFNIKV